VPMDILNDILDTLKLKGVLYFRTDFSGEWGTTVPQFEQAARFHYVVQGHCHVAFPTGEAVTLGAGDLILIPRGRSHTLSDAPERNAPPLEVVLDAVGYDGEGVLAVGDGDNAASTQMVCGHFNFRNGADHAVLRALPDYLVTSSSTRAKEPWLDEMLRLISRRIFSHALGSAAAVTRLSEIIFIELLRIGIKDSDRLRSVLEGFSDPHIGRALQLIHTQPSSPWTVETLASEIGMSRSRFAERFRVLMRTGPMAYLSEWRLQKALALLDDSRESIQQVATHTGYQSPAAFTRAFTGKFGVSPRDYRRISA